MWVGVGSRTNAKTTSGENNETCMLRKKKTKKPF
jgi:hypothetical protein